MLEFRFIDSQNYENELVQDGLGYFEDNIYTQAFPDPDEREPFDEIRKRLCDGSAYPLTYAVLAYDDDKVAGAQIFDWYADCSTVELIYIAVDPQMRGRGVGKRLLSEGTQLFCDEMSGRGHKVKRVLFETENPFLSPAFSGMDPIDRLRFFANNGARRIPFDYVQPPLSQDSGWAKNLFLCTLPQFADDEEGIDRDELIGFLRSFFKGLGSPANSREFKEMCDCISEHADASTHILEYQDLQEHSVFRIPHVSLVYHFKMETPDGIKKPNTVFNSYETDLMNYSFQDFEDRPIRTRFVDMVENAEIFLPRLYQYSSEGYSFYKLAERRKIKVSLSVSCSTSNSGNIELANLVISSNESFSELELIQLITAFGSKQENFNRYETLSFKNLDDGTVWDSCESLLAHFIPGSGFTRQHCGVSEIDVTDIHDTEGNPVFESMEDFREKSKVDECPDENDWNKVLCGLILGIMDHQRMNSAEIFDTIKPIVLRYSSFMVLNRGHLMKLEYEETHERIDKILISPYLLIPSALLCMNQLILDINEDKLKTPLKTKSGNYAMSRELSGKIMEISKSLTSEYYKDVFQYESERDIHAIGSRQRGHDNRYAYLNRLLDEENVRLEDYKSKYQLTVDSLENILLMILAFMELAGNFSGILKAMPVISIAIVVVGIAIFWRRKKL